MKVQTKCAVSVAILISTSYLCKAFNSISKLHKSCIKSSVLHNLLITSSHIPSHQNSLLKSRKEGILTIQQYRVKRANIFSTGQGQKSVDNNDENHDGITKPIPEILQSIRKFHSNAANYTSLSLGLSLDIRKSRENRKIPKSKSSNELHDNGRNFKRKVLILMSDTGGGHRASAEALQAAFEMEYPGCIDVTIADIWTENAPWPFNRFVPNYQYMARTPPIWKFFWEYGKYPLSRKFTEVWSNMQCHMNFRRRIEEENPDLVISVHPLCQDIPMRALTRMGKGKRQIPFVTVVTDLGGAHPTWFHPDIDMVFVPSEVLREMALRQQLHPDQIVLHGLPTRPGFWNPVAQDKASLQLQLGLQPGIKACLVVGGGDGVGGLAQIAEALIDKLAAAPGYQQLVVVCGKNEEVKERLEGIKPPRELHLKVLGFVQNMDEWMGAVDIIVTKAGPGTIAEATIRGLPIMLSAFLPGQEEGNVPYVVEGGYGGFSKDPEIIASTVTEWILDDKKLSKMSNNAKNAARPHATTAIARDIGKMLYAPAEPPTLSELQCGLVELNRPVESELVDAQFSASTF